MPASVFALLLCASVKMRRFSHVSKGTEHDPRLKPEACFSENRFTLFGILL
jgi:hypothetical protein